MPGPGSYIKDSNKQVKKQILTRLSQNSGSRTSLIKKRAKKEDLHNEGGQSSYNINDCMIKKTYNVALATDRFH